MNFARASRDDLLAECKRLGIDVAGDSTRTELIAVLKASSITDDDEAEAPALDRAGLLAKAEELGVKFPVDPRFINDDGLLELLDAHTEQTMTAVADGRVSLSAAAIEALNALGDKIMGERDKREGVAGLSPGFVTDGEIRSAPRVPILIPASSEPGGDLPVKVAVNGYACVIPRDVTCEVPRPILLALLDAKLTRFEQQGKPDPETGQVVFKELRSLRFPVLTGDSAQDFARTNPVEEHRYVSQQV